MKINPILIVVCFLTFVNMSIAQSPDEMLEQAKASFETGNYNKTIESYTELSSLGYASEDLHFNLATAYYKSGNLASAVLFYEKVLKTDPYHKAAATNLRIVNDERASELSAIPDFFITVWWNNLCGFLSSGLWSVLGIGAILFSLYFFYLWLMKRPTLRNLISSILLLCLGFVFLMAARTSHVLRNQTTHLINLNTATIFPSPDAKGEPVSQLIAGEKMRILDKVGDWYQVMLINKEQGWVSNKDLKEI